MAYLELDCGVGLFLIYFDGVVVGGRVGARMVLSGVLRAIAID